MREIKFRAWNKSSNMMTYLDSKYVSEGLYHYENGAHILMQYTGLHDKNGKEIYEGDLLKNGMGVVWSKYAFVPAYDWGRSDDFEDWGTDWSRNAEVIGNIYENPELIKEV